MGAGTGEGAIARALERDARLEIVTTKSPEALEVARRDAAHVMASVVQKLYPGTQVTIGPATPYHHRSGPALVRATRDIVRAFSNGPHIFNLGHGITPDADPDNVALMIETVRAGV